MKTRKPSMAALVAILKENKEPPKDLSWRDLEDHVRYVYQTLLDLKGEKVLVARDVTLRGTEGQDHQIDVYYEFELAGLRHRVAIECKNMQRPLDKDRVMAFFGKVDDCPGVRGCIVAANGYQSGAKQFAEKKGITALTLSDLPSIGQILGMTLEMCAVPSSTSFGQPFWAIYDLDEACPMAALNSPKYAGVLFISRVHAEAYLAKNKSRYPAACAVLGLTQDNLFSYILTVDAMGGGYMISTGGKYFVIEEISRRELISHFYVGKAPISDTPQVMPSVATRMARGDWHVDT